MSGALATALRAGLLLLMVVGLSLLQGIASAAQTQTVLGIDVVPGSNTAGLVNTIDTCVEVDVGEQFPIDIYITGADQLRAWEMRIALDHTIAQVKSADFNQFLLTTPPGGSISSLFDVEKADRYFLAAAESRTPDSGAGVLARLTLEAVGPGISPLSIVTTPSYFLPHLTDVQGDNPFSGPASHAAVAVSTPCASGAAKPTPTPTPGPDANATPVPTDGSALVTLVIPGEGGRATILPAAPTVLSDSARPTSGEGNDAGQGPGNSAEQGEGDPSTDAGEDGGGRSGLSVSPGDGSSDGFPMWILAPIIAAAAVLGAGGIAMALILRTRGER